MSLFDDLVAEMGVSALMEALGSSVTYTTAGGTDVSLTAMIEAEDVEIVETVDGHDCRQVREATIATDADGEWGGVAAPATRATVTIDDVEYAVESIVSVSANFARLKLVRLAGHERSRPDYRIRAGR